MAQSTPSEQSVNDLPEALKNPTLEVIPDRRGPAVYDLTETASLNGVDPNFSKKEGV